MMTHTDATHQLREALARTAGLPPASPELVTIVAAVEQAVPRLVEVVFTGYGSVTINIKNGRLAGVKWEQGMLF